MCGLFGFSDLQHSLTEKQASALANSLARASGSSWAGCNRNCLRTEWKTAYIQAPETCRADATAAPQRHDPTAGPCADDDPGEREEKL